MKQPRKGTLGLRSAVFRKHLLSVLVGLILVLQPWMAKAAVSITVNPGAYSGQWQILGVTSGLTGLQSVSINSGSYQVQVGDSNFGRFSINVAANGEVTSLNTAAANGAGNVLTFNTTPLTIDPGAYGNGSNVEGVYYLLGVASGVSSFQNPGPKTFTVVPNLGYQVQVGDSNFGRFSINVAANGEVTSLNTAAANGAGNVLTFNTTPLTIDPGAYGNGSNTDGDYYLLQVGGVHSFSNPGPQTFTVVPNLGYQVQVGGNNFGRFSINVDANGNVTSLNTAAASGSTGRLTFNTTRILINPDGFSGQWFVAGVFGGSGTKLLTVVPGLSYQFTTGSGSLLFSVASPCVINPPEFVIGGFTFNITCAPAIIAYAGPDQTVNEGTVVTLDGSGSSGENLSYQWIQIAGPTAGISNPTTPTPTVSTPLLQGGFGSQVLTFKLTVSSGSQSDSDTVDITELNINHAPESHPGNDQAVDEGALVRLNGGFSFDPDGDPITYQWTQTGGAPVSLGADPTDPTNPAKAAFIAPTIPGGVASAETLTFNLTVSDGALSSAASLNVTVENVDHAPTANAGNTQTVHPGATVYLLGSGDDPDWDAIAYHWTQLNGPAVTLVNATAATANFVAPSVSGTTDLNFRLTVSDGLLSSSSDVVVTVKNGPPVCYAARAVPDVLWPPNHGLVIVSISGVSDPDDGSISLRITSVTQDEAVNRLGDGDTSPDGVIQGGKVLLRAERSGTGNGRVYRVTFSADDGNGGTCGGSVNVNVPPNMKAGTNAVDSGQTYDSTVP